ncbi:Methyltransferase-like protein 7B [Rhizophlyctis rosea]|nr:Methyltransferase-like protein 7B [Rhizophlyctis rosea]
MPPLGSPRVFALVVGSVGLYGVAAYGGFHAYKVYKAPTPPPGIEDPKHQHCYTGVYNALAPEYDTMISMDEWFMGVGTLRWSLMKQAKGKVLEVSTGTGRNLEYYPKPQIDQLILSDTNESMLRRAFDKCKNDSLRASLPPLSFKIIDAENIPSPPAEFDTVVETFGLCSCADPVASLKEMARVCKPDGRILLLEHGRSYYNWLNDALDKTAGDHAQTWGCWWNRDIEGLIDQAGLEIVEIKRVHLGTTYYIVAKPGSTSSSNSAATTSDPKTLQLPLLALVATLRMRSPASRTSLLRHLPFFNRPTQAYRTLLRPFAPTTTRLLHLTRPTLSDSPPQPKPTPNIPLGKTDKTLLIGMTCKVCQHRQYKPMSRTAYEKGIVLIRCDGCQNLHLIADHIGWFDKPGNIEQILREKGESVERMRVSVGAGGEGGGEELQFVPEGVREELERGGEGEGKGDGEGKGVYLVGGGEKQ